MGGEADGLADGGGAAVGEGHHPGLQAALGPGDGGDAGAEGEALEGLVEGDGDEQDDELVADGDAEGHADEDGVEEDADLEHHALENVLLVLLGGGEDDSVGDTDGDGAGLLVDALGKPVTGLLVRLVVAADAGESAADAVAAGAAARGHLERVGARIAVVVFVGGLGGVRAEDGGVRGVGHVAGGREGHLDEGDEEDAGQGDGARHGGVVLDPEGAEAWVAEKGEGGREEVDEGGGEEDAGAEVADGEEEGAGDADARDAGGDERKRAGEEGNAEDDEESADVEGRVVLVFVAEAAGRAGRAVGDASGALEGS